VTAAPQSPLAKPAVVVAIRPEKVKLSRRGPATDGATSHGINRMEGVIVEANYLGGTTIYKVKLDSGAIVRSAMANTARLDADAYGAGQRVVAWFTPDDCMVLDR
jgi:putrescine transport system ATP-binding protein